MPRERNFSPLFILVAIIAVVTALFVAKQILLPIALSVLLSFLLTPLANRLEFWGLPRVPAVIVVVMIAFAVLGALGWIVTDQLVALRNEIPSHRAKIAAKARTLRQFTKGFERVGEELTNGEAENRKKNDPKDTDTGSEQQSADDDQGRRADQQPASADSTIVSQATRAVEDIAETGAPTSTNADDSAVPVRVVAMPPSPLTQVQTWLGPLVAPLTGAGMVFVLVFFMLLDRENQRNHFIQLFGTSNLHVTTEALTDATHRVGRYLRMQFLINATYGLAVALGLWLIGLPSAIMWGVLGFSLRFLPYLGPWLAAVMPILVSMAVSDGWTQPILVVGMYIVYELVLNNVAEPMLYGNSTGVSTVGVIVSAIFWTWLWGPVGLILAMPMTVCLVVTARYVPQLRFITVLLADQPSLSPAERVYQRLLAFDYQEPLKLAQKHLKSSPLVNFYDEILIPALILAEQDRHAGSLSEEQQQFVQEAAEDFVEELGDPVSATRALGATADDAATDDVGASDHQHDDGTPLARILCLPLRDEADETTSRMLGQLLKSEGFQVDAGSANALTSEMVDRVATTECDLVVISVLPPIRPRESRLLWKRLRHAYPELPIIVGYWLGPNATESLLPPSGDSSSKVATTLAEAVTLVRSEAAQLPLAKTR